jgi:acyl-CoA synthetase (AMP-forming)/AMP-acid ligase II/acyl carrier protein
LGIEYRNPYIDLRALLTDSAKKGGSNMKRESGNKCAYSLPLISLFEVCERFPEKKLFNFLKEQDIPGEQNKPVFLTGRTLAHKAKILGSALQHLAAPQKRSLLLLPQGLEYIYSLMACLFSNVIAIPVPITDSSQREQITEKINPILKDSHAEYIITDTYFKEFLKTQQAFNTVPMLDINELAQEDWTIKEARSQEPEDIALMLYTSGSTSQPKGVMISHSNLLSQALLGATQWGMNQDSCIFSWMPQFHNFGLNFNILAPLLKGASSIIISPSSFIKNPEVWFKTIHQYRATHTAAPNFAFDYYCSSIDLNSIKVLSLHSLQAIICGGEPVRKETYENFTGKFQSMGLARNVFCPHYGLSEMGSVTTKKPGHPLRFLSLDIPSLEQGKIKYADQKNKSRIAISCGEIGEAVKILIVHPEECEPCAPEEVGEIWIKSPSIGLGYFNRNQETEDTFLGILNNTNEGGFLRTGDLGFINDNHLYILGRQKEVMIIHGKNHHPIDIEWTIKNSSPNISLPIAVFSCEIDQQERVVVVQEVDTNESEYKKITQEILTAVSVIHELEVYEINLVRKEGIPRTVSGKIQRKACRNAHIKQELPVLYQYQHGISELKSKEQEPFLKSNLVNLAALKKEVLLPVLKIDPVTLDEATSLSELGVNSIQNVKIARKIEEVFEIECTPVMLFKKRSMEELVQYLSTQKKKPHSNHRIS